jgi:hypothetical protein
MAKRPAERMDVGQARKIGLPAAAENGYWLRFVPPAIAAHRKGLVPLLLAVGAAISAGTACSDRSLELFSDAVGGAAGTGGATGTGGGAGTGGTTGASAVKCTDDKPCGGATPHCDTAKGVCVACASDADCLGLKCDPVAHVCHDCVSNANCGGSKPICEATTHDCTATCTTDADCKAAGAPPHCDATIGHCFDCLVPQDCSGPYKTCELATHSCVGCLTDGDCTASAPTCSPSHSCSPKCTTDQNCPGGLFCYPPAGLCVECHMNQQCSTGVCQTDFTCG